MLNGPRNAAGHVKLGRHRLPGGTHLQPVIHPTCIHHRPTGSKLSAHRLGQFADHLHIFFFADASACADDNFGLSQVHATGIYLFVAQELHGMSVSGWRYLLHLWQTLKGAVIAEGTRLHSKHNPIGLRSVSYTHLRAHETDSYLVCRLLLEKKKK